MTSYLVRHGTAAAGPDDRTRPLTPAGRAEVEATARALAARGAEVAEIRHSGLVRARETAEILGCVLTPARGIRGTPGLSPEDAPDVAAAELAVAEAPLMLVGHLPHLGRLAAALVGGAALERIHFTPATAVGLRRGPGGWELELIVPPRGGAAP
jgi:phosphohistidine phosphatase